MKRSVFIEKLHEISVRSEKLESESRLVLDSSNFLSDEALKYLKISDDNSLPWEEREKSLKTLIEIYRRMDLELRRCDELEKESTRCRNEVSELFQQKREEGLEDDV